MTQCSGELGEDHWELAGTIELQIQAGQQGQVFEAEHHFLQIYIRIGVTNVILADGHLLQLREARKEV